MIEIQFGTLTISRHDQKSELWLSANWYKTGTGSASSRPPIMHKGTLSSVGTIFVQGSQVGDSKLKL